MKAADKRAMAIAIVQAIADGLNENQRAALLWLPADGSPRAEDKTVRSATLYSIVTRTVIPDVTARLASGGMRKIVNGKWVAPDWELTPLGVLVRDAVERESTPTHAKEA